MHERGCQLFACADACACKVLYGWHKIMHVSCMAYSPRLCLWRRSTSHPLSRWRGAGMPYGVCGMVGIRRD